MDVDISNFHPSRDRVITDAYKATQTRLISDIHHLLRDTFAPADGPQEPTAFKYKKVSNLWVVTPSKFQDELKSWGQRRYGDSYEGKRDGKQVLAQLQEIDGFDSNKSCRLEDYQHPVKVYAFDREAVCEYLNKYVFKHFSAETEEVL